MEVDECPLNTEIDCLLDISCVYKESKFVHDFTGFPMQLDFC
jgi:hypothetical protein